MINLCVIDLRNASDAVREDANLRAMQCKEGRVRPVLLIASAVADVLTTLPWSCGAAGKVQANVAFRKPSLFHAPLGVFPHRCNRVKISKVVMGSTTNLCQGTGIN